MATERVSMRKVREILRLKWELRRSHRDVAASLGVSTGAISSALSRATAAGLDWSAVERLADDVVEQRLYGPKLGPRVTRPAPDCAYLHAERSRPGVTLELLHLEYLERHPDGYRYTAFCDLYRRWLAKRRLTMRQIHLAGEKLFVDYAGDKPHIVDPDTGEVIDVELFVAVLGASNYTYAEATRTQSGPDWIASHMRALAYFGGVPAAMVCDQLKSGVVVPCRYEPGVQRTYEDLARHYGTTILPARAGKPRDKAKVEVGVLVVERWILARLRNETFFSLDALDDRIAELLEDLNGRHMKTYGASRRELYERLDRPALRPLPPDRFVYGEWKVAKVNIDYHVEVDHHYYSVHHSHVHEAVDVRLAATTIEVFLRGERIASHARSSVRAASTTLAEHMPKAHQKHIEWTPSRMIRWAATIGPSAADLVRAILADRPHPEQGYRSCLGILRLARRYGPERLEAACVRALAAGARSYRHVESILKNGLDRAPLPAPEQDAPRPTPDSDDVRGPNYYE